MEVTDYIWLLVQYQIVHEGLYKSTEQTTLIIGGGDHLQKDMKFVRWKLLYFEKSQLPLQKWLVLMHWWSGEYPVTDAATEVVHPS